MRFKEILIEEIVVNKNIRSDVDEELGGLMESIDKYDVIQPVLVIPKDGKYELVAGHRRYAALKDRGESTVPCIIRGDLSSRDIPFIKLVENVQRKQMSPCELVKIFDEMMEKNPGLTKHRIALMLGKSNSWVYDKYRAEKIYIQLIESGFSEEDVNDLSELDLKRLSHIKNPFERSRIAGRFREKKTGKAKMIKSAESYELEERGTYREDLGGFSMFYSAKTNLKIICKNKEIRDEIVKILYKYKLKRMNGENRS